MTLQEIDQRFDELSDMTDRVALMNSRYDSDLDAAFTEMENFIRESKTWDIEMMSPEHRQVYMSHLSFHREIVAEIIREARDLLLNDRRNYLKRLVNYHKDFSDWLGRIEKRYAA